MQSTYEQTDATILLTSKEARKGLRRIYRNCNHLVDRESINFSRVDSKRDELRAFYAEHQFTPYFLNQRYAKLDYEQSTEGEVLTGLCAGIVSAPVSIYIADAMNIRIGQSIIGSIAAFLVRAIVGVGLAVGIGILVMYIGRSYKRLYLSPKAKHIKLFEMKLIEQKMKSQFQFEIEPEK